MTRIISLTGLINAGKDTAAEILINEYGFVKVSFGGNLKDSLSAIFGWDRNMLEGVTAKDRAEREKVDTWWANRLGIPKLSPRLMMQHYGTDVCRKHLHTDIWVASLENKIRLLGNAPIVVTDGRFLNELQFLSNIGATTVCIKRGADPDWFEMAQTENGRRLMGLRSDVHPSEWDWAPWKFDVTITNNRTIVDLQTAVANLVTDHFDARSPKK